MAEHERPAKAGRPKSEQKAEAAEVPVASELSVCAPLPQRLRRCGTFPPPPAGGLIILSRLITSAQE